MKTTKLAVCSLLRVCASGRFFVSLRLWRGRPEPIGDGYGRSTDAAGSIRPVVTNLVPAAVEVANNNERRSIAVFMNFNPRGRKMKPKLVFCFMPKMRQWSNGMAKAMKLLMLLLASGLMSAPAHSTCYTWIDLGNFEFQEFSGHYAQGNGYAICRPSSVNAQVASDEDELWSFYNSAFESCHSNVEFEWGCPVRHRWNNVNQVHSAWQRALAECKQFFTNQYNKYKGRMCHDE